MNLFSVKCQRPKAMLSAINRNMAASVQVLCPNGRRQTVKVTPNTKLLQVLEEVCQRQGFIPPEDFKLIQGRKNLDLSLSFRFSSLPNNAKLELAKSTTSRVEQDVTIALQLDSGQRLQDRFLPSVTLWDMLLHFEDQDGNCKGQLTKIETSQGKCVQPVCIFMREEVIGEPALKATTLKKLALTSGKAIIRLLHRPVKENMLAEICDQVEKDKAKQARLEEMGQRKKEMLEEREREESLKASLREQKLSQVEEVEDSDMSASGDESLQMLQQPPPPQQQQQHQRQQQQRQQTGGVVEEMDVDGNDDGGEDNTVSSTSFSEDSSARQRSARTKGSSNPASSSGQRPPPPPTRKPNPMQELRDLNIPGVQIITPDDFNDLTPQEQAIARRLAQRFMPQLQQAASPLTSVQPIAGVSNSDEQSASAFLDFKFPEETRGRDLSTAESSSSFQPDSTPCDRYPLVYDARQALPISNQELPDSFFEVSQSDVRLMYKDLQNAVHKMEEQPLMTKTMKQAHAEAAYDHYQRVAIRIHFPDKLVLQAFFRPRETVGALHSFVRECLRDKKLKFYLYTTPPKTILKDMKSSLALNHLAPATLVYFGCNEERDHHIRQDLLNELRSRLEAETCVAEVLKQGESDPQHTGGHSSTDLHSAGPSGMSSAGRFHSSSSSSSSSSRPATLPSGATVPKWLKLGKK